MVIDAAQVMQDAAEIYDHDFWAEKVQPETRHEVKVQSAVLEASRGHRRRWPLRECV